MLKHVVLLGPELFTQADVICQSSEVHVQVRLRWAILQKVPYWPFSLCPGCDSIYWTIGFNAGIWHAWTGQTSQSQLFSVCILKNFFWSMSTTVKLVWDFIPPKWGPFGFSAFLLIWLSYSGWTVCRKLMVPQTFVRVVPDLISDGNKNKEVTAWSTVCLMDCTVV